jgi:High potential iron-sulfur protein
MREERTMQRIFSRRDVMMKGALLAGAVVPAFGRHGAGLEAAELALLDGNDPTAKALDFVTDATKVNASADSSFKPGQHCGVCAQFRGK